MHSALNLLENSRGPSYLILGGQPELGPEAREGHYKKTTASPTQEHRQGNCTKY